MDIYNNPFSNLQSRLYSLTTEQKYVDFHYANILVELDGILNIQSPIDKIDSFLHIISDLTNKKESILDFFYVTEWIKVALEDEYGNKSVVDSEEVRPMTPFERNRIYQEIRYELFSYSQRLKNLKHFIGIRDDLKSTLGQSMRGFKFLLDNGHLKSMHKGLIDNGFVSSACSPEDFSAAFSGGYLSSPVVSWQESVSALKFFIGLIRKRELIEDIKNGDQWRIGAATFNILGQVISWKTLQGQKNPKVSIQHLLNSIVPIIPKFKSIE